jgi:hypothetical protein
MLAPTFAAITRVRRGVTSSVGRIVPVRNSAVIDSAPKSAANSAPIAVPSPRILI